MPWQLPAGIPLFATIDTLTVLPESVAPKFTPAHVSSSTATLAAAAPSVDSDTSRVSGPAGARRHGAEAHADRIERNVGIDCRRPVRPSPADRVHRA